MKKELKKQMKQDELRTGFGHAVEWASVHRDEVRVTLIALLVIGLAAVGYSSYRSHRQASAAKAFDEALTIFHAPVAGDPDASLSGGTVYATAAEKNQKAAAAFAEVAGRYGSSTTGRRARYYAALANSELGKTAEAEAELKDLSAGGDDTLVRGLSRLALADLHRSKGDWDPAIEGYRKIIDDADSAIPRDHALMRLGSTLEAAQRSAEAVQAYRRLTEEYPASVYAADARSRREYLGDRG
jgi:predicted negative regulator of RcsB-dependent stress response